MKLIDADLLEKEIYKWMPKDQETWMDSDIPPIENLVVSIMMTIQEQPTVDAVPVRYGKWLDPETLKRPWFRHHIFECSVCRNILDMDGVNAGRGDANYCPNCGARMKGSDDE